MGGFPPEHPHRLCLCLMQSLACRIRGTEPKRVPLACGTCWRRGHVRASWILCVSVTMEDQPSCPGEHQSGCSIPWTAGSRGREAISLVIFCFSDLLRGSHSYSLRSLCLLSLWCHEISNRQMTLAGASPRQTSGWWGGERGGRHCKNAGNSCQFPFLLNVTSGFSSFFLVLELQGKMHDYVG